MSRDQFMVIKAGIPLNAYFVFAIDYAHGLEESCILNMLLMPHFGYSGPVGMYVKQLLVCFHGGYLWLNKPYEVMVDLVLDIIGLPWQGVDPSPYLHKDGEKLDKNDMKNKY